MCERVRVTVCVCVGEREGVKEAKREGDREGKKREADRVGEIEWKLFFENDILSNRSV